MLLILTIVFALLALFPERYRAAATISPTDPASFGLSGALNQLGATNTVFGNQSAVEVALKVAKSVEVRSIVAQRAHLGERLHMQPIEVSRWLDRKFDIRSLRGGMIQLELKDQDAKFARDLVTIYTLTLRDRLAEIGTTQTKYKRDILLSLVDDASSRLARAREAYDNFRLSTRYSSPYSSIQSIGARIPTLEQAIKAKDVELAAARRFVTDDNPQIQQILAQRAALEGQLSAARALDPSQLNTVGRVVKQSTEAERLLRNLELAQGLYENYRRILLGTSVEELTSNSSLRFLERPYIDTERQINMQWAALALVTLLCGLIAEAYSFRPPIGDRVRDV